MRILDVGSGNEINFNTDVYEVIHIDIVPNSFCLEFVCSGFNLPFVDGSFDIVHCSHVLEHVRDPWSFFLELKRVTKKAVVLKIPNSSFYKLFSCSPEHIFGWSPFNFENLLNRIFRKVEVSGSWRITNHRGAFGKLQTIKVYLLSLFSGYNELTGVCWV